MYLYNRVKHELTQAQCKAVQDVFGTIGYVEHDLFNLLLQTPNVKFNVLNTCSNFTFQYIHGRSYYI